MAPQPWQPSNGTLQWHPEQWHPSNGTEKSHPSMAGTNGACGRVHCRPHPTLSLSIGILMKTSSSLALQSHIAPSHRRLPHLSWTTSFSLLLDLLIGAGKTRYLNTRPHARSHRDVFVRGFSAGSYSGICLLHLLWQFPSVDARGKLGGIACPPELLATIPIDKGLGLHLFHYDRKLKGIRPPSKRLFTTSRCSIAML